MTREWSRSSSLSFALLTTSSHVSVLCLTVYVFDLVNYSCTIIVVPLKVHSMSRLSFSPFPWEHFAHLDSRASHALDFRFQMSITILQ